MITDLPEGFHPIPSDIVPELDQTIKLVDRTGREYRGCLIDGFGNNEGCYWAEWICDNGLEERVGKDSPVGWKSIEKE